MSNRASAITSFIAGGIAFWAPTVALLPPTTSERMWMVAVSLVSPAALAACWYLMVRLKKRGEGPSSSLFALAGVWVSGPLFMMTAAAIRTPGMLHDFNGLEYAYVWLLSLFPGYTLFLSAAQGSAYALVLGTILMVACHVGIEKEQWLIPPAWKWWHKRLH